MAAAAACRGSTSSGGTGCCPNQVMTRNIAERKTCAQICAQIVFRDRQKEEGVGISVQASLLVLSLSFPKHLSNAMTTLYRKALAPARKPYRKRLFVNT